MKNKKILITVTDITRPCPDKLILNILLDYLIKAGVNKKDITILIANGLHRKMTKKEMSSKYGNLKFNIKNHDALKDLTNFGQINGIKIKLNKNMKNADIIFSIGIIEPHHYAGFSGGAKSVAIGLAGEGLINYTHSYKFITNKKVLIGNIKNNPFQKFLWDIIAKTKKDFYFINVVMHDKKISDVAYGSTFNEYSGFIFKKQKYFIKKCPQKYDAVVLNVYGGKGSNFYQASRAFTYVALTHNSIIKKDGFIILNAKMEEGFGYGLGEARFEEVLRKSKNLNDLIKNVKNSRCGGIQRAILFSQALKRNKLIICGAKSDLKILEKFDVKILDNINAEKKCLLQPPDKKVITINDPFGVIYVS